MDIVVIVARPTRKLLAARTRCIAKRAASAQGIQYQSSAAANPRPDPYLIPPFHLKWITVVVVPEIGLRVRSAHV